MFAAGMSHEPSPMERVQEASKLHNRNGGRGPRSTATLNSCSTTSMSFNLKLELGSLRGKWPLMALKQGMSLLSHLSYRGEKVTILYS